METNPPRNNRLELVDADERREQRRCLFPAFLYSSDRQIPYALKNSRIKSPRKRHPCCFVQAAMNSGRRLK